MSEASKQEAATHAKRAARQGKNAAKNGIRAVNDVADVAADEAQDAAQKVEDAVEDAVNEAKQRFRSSLAPDVGMLALELTLSLYMSGRAYLRYRKIQGFRKGHAQAMKDWIDNVQVEVD